MDSDSGPMISVVIPAFNRETSIERAISSVRGRHSGLFELIVVDDGSGDQTLQRAEAAVAASGYPDARVLGQRNAGPGAARNTGAAQARGDYLAFLDSDDLWLPWTLACAVEALRSEANRPALIFLQTVDVSEDALPLPQAEIEPRTHRFAGFLEATEGFPTTRYGSCNVLVRRDVFEALGGYTTDVRCSEDTDLFLRAADRGECLVISGGPLVAHVIGRDDKLTGNFPAVLDGLNYMFSRERGGFYPEAPSGGHRKDRMLSQCVAHTVREGFAAGGYVGASYRLYFTNIFRLLRAGNWHWLIRLPLMPFLAFIRPSSYRVRWNASRGL